jgi:hypothetical protein
MTPRLSEHTFDGKPPVNGILEEREPADLHGKRRRYIRL